jgi:hypothetical protein
MKKIIFMSLILPLLISCNNEDLDFDEITGKWQLVEVLMDPGDGSGTFESVTSNRTITFAASGEFIAKGELCDISISDTNASSGSYSTGDETLTIDDCIGTNNTISYILDDKSLILVYTCIEGCRHKYEKIED